MAEVAHSDGRRALMPKKFLPHWNQQMIDSMVMQLFRGNVVDRATCRAVGMRHVDGAR